MTINLPRLEELVDDYLEPFTDLQLDSRGVSCAASCAASPVASPAAAAAAEGALAEQ